MPFLVGIQPPFCRPERRLIPLRRNDELLAVALVTLMGIVWVVKGFLRRPVEKRTQ